MIRHTKNNTALEAYFDSLFPHARKELQKLRACVRGVIPNVEEGMKYGIPTCMLNGKNIVHYAAYTTHIGFYPGPSGIAQFKKELSAYKTSKGAVQFPLGKAVPLSLIRKIVRFRLKEEKARVAKRT